MIKDLEVKINNNPISHLFTNDIEGCQRNIINEINKTLITQIKSETNVTAVIVKSSIKKPPLSYKRLFIENNNNLKCIKSPSSDKNSFPFWSKIV